MNINIEEMTQQVAEEDAYFFMNDADFSNVSCPLESEPVHILDNIVNVSLRSSTLPRPFHRGVMPTATAVPVSVFGNLTTNIAENEQLEENETEIDTPNFYDWRIVCPELSLFLENMMEVRTEVCSVQGCRWQAWPEALSYEAEQMQAHDSEAVLADDVCEYYADTDPYRDQTYSGAENSAHAASWTVLPFLHTFPATDPSRSTWVKSCTDLLPFTTSLLRRIPNIRTALFSRLGPNTKLVGHTGWEDLANYVLRVHVPIEIPPAEMGACGLSCNNEVQHHCPGEIMVFDDSKYHYAFNYSTADRVVLIIDILRPPDMPEGICLNLLVSCFWFIYDIFAVL